MDNDAGHMRDELRRSRNSANGLTDAGKEDTRQQGTILPGVLPLADTLRRGRGGDAVRAAALQSAQRTYGNTSVQRYLRGHNHSSQPIPVQRYYIMEEFDEDKLAEVGSGITASNWVPSKPAPAATSDLDIPRPSTNASGIEIMSLAKRFEKETEQHPSYKGNTDSRVAIRTKYLNDQERRPYQVSVGDGGRLYQGGERMETGGQTTKTNLRAEGSAGGHLFAMSPTGEMYAADQAAMWEEGGMQGQNATVRRDRASKTYVPTDPNAASAEAYPFHHSSFLAGGDVMGAGEMKVHDGLLSMISNASGHYKPGPKQLLQSLNQLQSGGASIDQARVHLMGELTSQGYDASKEVTAAAGEFMHVMTPNVGEKKPPPVGGEKAALLHRHKVLSELRTAFGEGVGPMKGQAYEAPESSEVPEAQKEALTTLGKRNPFNSAFRAAKAKENASPSGQKYSDFMRNATGRAAKPKAQSAFSFSMPEPSIAPVSAPEPSNPYGTSLGGSPPTNVSYSYLKPEEETS